MINLIIGLLVAFIALYLFEGKLEVRERTHSFAKRLAVTARKMIHYKGIKARYLDEPTTEDGDREASPHQNTYIIGVKCTLGNPLDEQGSHGLKWYPDASRDGICDLAAVSINNSGRITDNKSGVHYFYFRFDPRLVDYFRKRLVYIIVEYYDMAPADEGSPDMFLGIAYDSCLDDGIAARFKATRTIRLTGDSSWKEAVFSLSDGGFTNRSNGADFRVSLQQVNFETEREAVVRRVIVMAVD